MKNVLLFLIFSIFFSCQPAKDGQIINKKDFREIKVDYNFDENKFRTSELIDEVKAVKFKLPTQLVVAEVSKVFWKDDNIIVMDRISSRVFCFSLDGEFIFQINAQGNGPGEYRGLDDMSLNHITNEIEILDLYGLQVLNYSMETGEFINNSRFSFFTYGFSRLKDKRVFYNSHLPNGEIDTLDISSSSIFITDTKNKILEDFFEIPSGLDRLPFVTRFGLFNNEAVSGGTNFVPLYNNEIYNITDESVRLSYKINLGDHQLPAEALSSFRGNVRDWISHLNENGYAFNLTNFLETDQFVSFEHVLNKRTINTIYDKAQKTAVSYPRIKIEDDLGVGQINIIGTVDQRFVISVKQENFNKKHRFLEKNKVNSNDIRRKYLNTFTTEVDNDDDLLILVTFKSLK